MIFIFYLETVCAVAAAGTEFTFSSPASAQQQQMKFLMRQQANSLVHFHWCCGCCCCCCGGGYRLKLLLNSLFFWCFAYHDKLQSIIDINSCTLCVLCSLWSISSQLFLVSHSIYSVHFKSHQNSGWSFDFSPPKSYR